MRIIATILFVSVCCTGGFAQQTETQTLPEKKLSVLDVARMQIRFSEALKQQGQNTPVDAEKLRSQGIEIVPATRLVIKDGAVYMMVTNDTLMPMSGGGASGCLPKNPKNTGQLISIDSQTDSNQTPAKNPAKKN